MATPKESDLELFLLEEKTSSRLEDNEDEVQRPVHLRPEDDTEPPPADLHGKAVHKETQAAIPALLAKAFHEFQPASSKDKSFIAQHFSTKDYESHSPLLRKYAQAGHIPSGASLAERVRKLLP